MSGQPRELTPSEWESLEPLVLEFRRAKTNFELAKAKMDHQVEILRLECNIPDSVILETEAKTWMKAMDARQGIYVKFIPDPPSET